MSDTTILETSIRQRISDAGGFLPFDSFMQAALYEPGLGYYETQAIFGDSGDFITGADLGPWLSLGFSDLILWGWRELGQPSEWILLEQGGGSGRLLLSVLKELEKQGICLPARIIEVECSQNLIQAQKKLFLESGFVIEHLASLADAGALENVLVMSNELPDAFPVRCFRWKDGEFFERGVADRNGFQWQDSDTPLQHDVPLISEVIRKQWPEGYCSEWNPGLRSWQKELAAVIKRGYSFCVDYGYSQQEYYRANRQEGTLLAHFKHQAVDTVFAQLGLQDITAHIDFSAMLSAGLEHDLKPLLWMPQGAWLAQSPLVQERVRQLAISPDVESLRLMTQAKRMLLPSGMGESFKLFVQGSSEMTTAPTFLSGFNRVADIRIKPTV